MIINNKETETMFSNAINIIKNSEDLLNLFEEINDSFNNKDKMENRSTREREERFFVNAIVLDRKSVV